VLWCGVPISSTHAKYDASAAAWARARDVLAGEDAVKAAGERYLPRLDSQSEEEYAGHQTPASLFGAGFRRAFLSPQLAFPARPATPGATKPNSPFPIGYTVCNLGYTFCNAIQGEMRNSQVKTEILTPLWLIPCFPILNTI